VSKQGQEAHGELGISVIGREAGSVVCYVKERWSGYPSQADWFALWYTEAGGSWVRVVRVRRRASGNGEPERWACGARERLRASLPRGVGVGVGGA
jgi:hypothetical protein